MEADIRINPRINIITTYLKKENILNLLESFNMTSLKVKDKADIEPYGLEEPTPSVDYKEDYAPFEDIKSILKKWLEV